MKVTMWVVLLSIAVVLPLSAPSFAVSGADGSSAVAMTVATSAVGQATRGYSTNRGSQTGNRQNQTTRNAGNTTGLADLTQLIMMLTGEENWGTVRVLGPTGGGNEVVTGYRGAF